MRLERFNDRLERGVGVVSSVCSPLVERQDERQIGLVGSLARGASRVAGPGVNVSGGEFVLGQPPGESRWVVYKEAVPVTGD